MGENPELQQKSKEKIKIKPEEILQKFLGAKTYEEEKEALKLLDNLDASELYKLERSLIKEESIEKRKLNILQTKIDIQQEEILELLPEFPIKRKYAVIINTDPYEDKHVNNVKRSIKALRKIGFEDFIVVHDGEIEKSKDINIYQYPSTKTGIGDALSDLGKILEKDDMVFFYTTGHGHLLEEKNPETGALAVKGKINEKPIDKNYLVENLKAIKEKEARAIFTFDNCYTGAFPHAIIQSGIEGTAFSSAIEGKESLCQFFAPELFDLIENGFDANSDHLSTIQEIYRMAMAHYRLETKTNEFGELAKSIDELTEKNYEKIINSPKPTLVILRTTWCPACDALEKELSKIWGILGDQVNIVRITTDVNIEEAGKLMGKMGISPPEVVPQIYFTKDNGKNFPHLIEGFKKKEILAKELEEKLNIAFGEEELINALSKKTDKSFEEVKRFVDLGIIDYEIIVGINYLEDFLAVKDEYPDNFSISDKALLFSKGIKPKTEIIKRSEGLRAKDIADLSEYYDGDWISAWETAKNSFTSEEYTTMLLKLNNFFPREKFDAYGNNFSFSSKINLIKKEIDAEKAKEWEQKYPKEIPEELKVSLILKNISPELVEEELKKKTEIKLTIHGKCYIIAKLGEIPDDLDKKISNYPDAFDFNEKIDLLIGNISPEKSKKYSKVINVNDIIDLDRLSISESKFLSDIENYPMFSTTAIINFYQSKIDLAEAKNYDLTRFFPYEIALLIKVPATIANLYHKKLKAKEISTLYKNNLLPNDVNSKIGKFKDDFNNNDIVNLLVGEVPLEKANEYAGVFGWDQGNYIAKFYKEGILTPDLKNYLALTFDQYRITPDVVFQLSKAGVPPNKTIEYDKGLSTEDIVNLYKAGWDGKKTKIEFEKYDKRFQLQDKILLLSNNISPEDSKKYPANLSAFSIKKLKDAGFTPEKTQEKFRLYNSRFNDEEKTDLLLENIPPAIASKYNKELDGWIIVKFYKKGWLPEAVDKRLKSYDPKFNTEQITQFLINDIPQKEANYFPAELTAFQISKLLYGKIRPEFVKKMFKEYDNKYTSDQKYQLIIEGIPVSVANKYAQTHKKIEDYQFIFQIKRKMEEESQISPIEN